MRFSLDDLEGPLALRLRSSATESKQLDEHEDLLKRGSQLVGHVRQKALPRFDEADLASQRRKAGDRQHDASREKQQGSRDARFGNSSGDEVLRDIRSQRG